MTERISTNELYMRFAEVTANRSKAIRKKVGCVVVKDNNMFSDENILSFGYNGLPKNSLSDVCEIEVQGQLVTKDDIIHAEMNALMKILKNQKGSTSGASIFVTMSPCKDCAKLIGEAGIKNVFYREEYRDSSGIDRLRSYNVNVIKL